MVEPHPTETNYFHSCFRWILLILAARCAMLPLLPLMDPTEGRYAVIAKEMAESGDWVTPQLWMDGQKVPFLGKPPLYFWCAAGCMKLFGINEFSARLPGLLSFAMILLIAGEVLLRYTSKEIAWRTLFLILSSSILFVAGGVVIVDMMVAMTVTAALFAYFAFTQETSRVVRRWWSLLVFLMLAAGFMTKGPVAIVLFGLPVLLWTIWFGRWSEILDQQWYWGITLFALMTIPWFMLAEQKNPGFIRYFFINENLLRFVVHDYGDKYGSGHDYIRGTAIVMMILAAIPWSLYLPIRWFQLRKQLLFRDLFLCREAAFFFSIVAANTLFWAMARQILIAYLFPTIPAFAAWVSMLMSRYPCLYPKRDPLLKKSALAISLGTLAAIAVAFPILSPHSTRQVIQTARNYSCNTAYSLYFVRRIPYSAYFYDGDNVISHPTESVEECALYASLNTRVLYITDSKYWDEIPASFRRKCTVLKSEDKYILFTRKEINP